jgi:hypothetical protein
VNKYITQNTFYTAIRRNLYLVYVHLNIDCIEDADLLFHSILSKHPNHPKALNFLGIIPTHLNRPEVAIAMTKRTPLKTPSLDFQA